MFDTQEFDGQKFWRLLVGFAMDFVLVVVTLSTVFSTFATREEARIINPTNSDPEAQYSLITDEDMARVKKGLYALLNQTRSVEHDFDTIIRWETLEQKAGAYPSTSFIVDIDEYQQTFRVTIDQYAVLLSCPELNISKYPTSFCIGNDGDYDDSISVVFGAKLPYSGVTSAGENFWIDRSSFAIMENPYDRFLEVYVRACPYNDNVATRAREAAEEIIGSLGADPVLFKLKVYSAGGCHGE